MNAWVKTQHMPRKPLKTCEENVMHKTMWMKTAQYFNHIEKIAFDSIKMGQLVTIVKFMEVEKHWEFLNGYRASILQFEKNFACWL